MNLVFIFAFLMGVQSGISLSLTWFVQIFLMTLTAFMLYRHLKAREDRIQGDGLVGSAHDATPLLRRS